MANKGRVLIVDDESINCSVLISLLQDYSTIIALMGDFLLPMYKKSPD